MGYLWGIIACKIYRLDGQVIQYSSKGWFERGNVGNVENEEIDILKTLVKSMPERCANILKRKGSKIED